MHHQRAVAVEHALGMPGGAGGVTEPGRVVLADGRGREVRQLGLDQLLVIDGALRDGLAVPPDDDVARLHLRAEAFPERPEHVVEDHHRIVGVIDDVRDVLHREPRIERVQDGAAEGDSEVRLQMTAVVPGERRDAVARLHAQPRERVGELLRAAMEFAIRAALDRPVRPAPDDLVVCEELAGAIEEVHEREGDLHHQSVHGALRSGPQSLHP